MDHAAWMAAHGLSSIEKHPGHADQSVHGHDGPGGGVSQANRAKAQGKGKRSYRDAAGRRRRTDSASWKAENPLRRAGKAAGRQVRGKGRRNVERAGKVAGALAVAGAVGAVAAGSTAEGRKAMSDVVGHPKDTARAGKQFVRRMKDAGPRAYESGYKRARTSGATSGESVKNGARSVGSAAGRIAGDELHQARRKRAKVGKAFDYDTWLADNGLEPIAKHPGHADQSVHGHGAAGPGRRQKRIDRRIDRQLDRTAIIEHDPAAGRVSIRRPSATERAHPQNRAYARRTYRRNNAAAALAVGASVALIAGSAHSDAKRARAVRYGKADPSHDAWMAAHGLEPLVKHPGHADQSVHAGGHGKGGVRRAVARELGGGVNRAARRQDRADLRGHKVAANQAFWGRGPHPGRAPKSAKRAARRAAVYQLAAAGSLLGAGLAADAAQKRTLTATVGGLKTNTRLTNLGPVSVGRMPGPDGKPTRTIVRNPTERSRRRVDAKAHATAARGTRSSDPVMSTGAAGRARVKGGHTKEGRSRIEPAHATETALHDRLKGRTVIDADTAGGPKGLPSGTKDYSGMTHISDDGRVTHGPRKPSRTHKADPAHDAWLAKHDLAVLN